MVERDIIYQVNEINWLIENDMSQVQYWRKPEGGFKLAGHKMEEGRDWLEYYASTQATVEKALAYLKGKNYIYYEKNNESYRIFITIGGCDTARDLQTAIGRINVWYKENKDGILWFALTALISLIVSLVTTLFASK